jgi:hypothetical protein
MAQIVIRVIEDHLRSISGQKTSVAFCFLPQMPQDEDADDCPLHAENPPFNVKVLAAIKEGDAIFRHKIPTKWYHSLEEARKDIGV